ncbi:DUF2993 domain-containing protein [Microbacterium sp.]|uniref:DUF2993 domain-containing protein n=1 Tax=Microbacterium sp. TaxID=51671 RepID=UPI0037C8937D
MSRGLPEAQPGYRWELQVPSAPQRRHPGRWIAAIIVLLVLLAAAVAAAEWLAREVTTNSIRNAVKAELGLPRDQVVEVDVPGIVLVQLAKGTLDEVTITSDDVTLGALTGDMTVHATGLPVRGDDPLQSVAATVVLDEAQLRALLGTVEGFPADSVALDDPDVTMTYPLQVLGVDVPIGVALTPGASAGDLVLTPSAFQVGDSEISADDLRDRFGPIAQTVLGDWQVCIAEHLPAGVTLTGVDVSGGELVGTVAVDGRIAIDPELQENGTCE